MFIYKVYKHLHIYIHVQNHDIFYKHRGNFNGTFFFINDTYTQQIYSNYYIKYSCLNLKKKIE